MKIGFITIAPRIPAKSLCTVDVREMLTTSGNSELQLVDRRGILKKIDSRSLVECEARCIPDKTNVCMLHRDIGDCKLNIERFYYDKQKKKCVTFVYGGELFLFERDNSASAEFHVLQDVVETATTLTQKPHVKSSASGKRSLRRSRERQRTVVFPSTEEVAMISD